MRLARLGAGIPNTGHCICREWRQAGCTQCCEEDADSVNINITEEVVDHLHGARR